MTREEQIVEYANSFKGKGIESDELKEIVRLAIIDGAKWADAHPQKPSLPSNLDEAEFEYAQSLDEMPANQEEEIIIYDAFKAGAEWMAGQGICIPAHIFMPCEIKDVYYNSKGEYPAAIHPDCGGSLVLERYLKDFKHNEEVIMQIRRKDE